MFLSVRNLAAFAFLALGSACSLLTDLDALDANVGRAGDDAAAHEGSVDATALLDGSTDGSSIDGDGPPVCPSGAFCQSFDESMGAGDGFDRAESAPGASLSLSDDIFRSPARSLRVELTGTNVFAYATVTKEWTLGLQSGSLRMNLRLERASTDRTYPVMSFSRFGGAPDSQFLVEIGPGTIVLREQRDGASVRTEKPFVWPVRKWLAVRVDFDLASRRATVRVDGAPILADVALTYAYTEPRSRIFVGAEGNTGSTGLSLHLDDIVYDVR